MLKTNIKKLIFIIYIIVFVFVISVAYEKVQTKKEGDKGGVEVSVLNYKDKVEELSKQFDISENYLFALIMLECSGRKNVPYRYEDKVYKKLKLVKEGRLDRLENITKKDLKGLSDKTIKKMASSWGPFQIMGYKCFYLNISLDELIGDNNMYWAVKWINLTYGDYVRKKEYKHAFHIHNAGKKYPKKGPPKTYSPNYVKDGLWYMKKFSKIFDSLTIQEKSDTLKWTDRF